MRSTRRRSASSAWTSGVLSAARAVVPGGAQGYQWQDERRLEAAPEISQSVWDLASGSLWTTTHDWTRRLVSYARGELFDPSYIDGVLLTSRDLDNGHPVSYSFGNWIGEFGETARRSTEALRCTRQGNGHRMIDRLPTGRGLWRRTLVQGAAGSTGRPR